MFTIAHRRRSTSRRWWAWASAAPIPNQRRPVSSAKRDKSAGNQPNSGCCQRNKACRDQRAVIGPHQECSNVHCAPRAMQSGLSARCLDCARSSPADRAGAVAPLILARYMAMSAF
jgi:hypothetical protein